MMTVHPQRDALHHEVHARPYERLTAPLMLTHVGLVEADGVQTREHLRGMLRDRHLLLYPDAGCYDKWAEKMKRLREQLSCRVEISELIERHASQHQRAAGYDLADYILEELL